MTAIIDIHHKTPQERKVRQAVEHLKKGLIVYPTDSYYAFGCLQSNMQAIEQIRSLRGLTKEHFFTLSCKDLGQIGNYGSLDNSQFRLIRSHIPGPYTFILKAGKEVAKKLHHPSRRTMAFRIQSHPVVQALLAELDEAIITSTLKLANYEHPLAYEQIQEKLKGKVDAIIDSGPCDMHPTTVLDFTENPPRLIREGLGEVDVEE